MMYFHQDRIYFGVTGQDLVLSFNIAWTPRRGDRPCGDHLSLPL